MPTREALPFRFQPFWEFDRFSYYSVVEDGEASSIASKSLVRIESDESMLPLAERFLEMMEQIAKRCNNIRDFGMLRGEISAWALPPDTSKMKRTRYLHEFCNIAAVPSLRWYGFDADNRILLLFDLGFKTHDDPTQCANVAELFRFADNASTYLTDNKKDWHVQNLDLVLTDERFPLWL